MAAVWVSINVSLLTRGLHERKYMMGMMVSQQTHFLSVVVLQEYLAHKDLPPPPRHNGALGMGPL